MADPICRKLFKNRAVPQKRNVEISLPILLIQARKEVGQLQLFISIRRIVERKGQQKSNQLLPIGKPKKLSSKSMVR